MNHLVVLGFSLDLANIGTQTAGGRTAGAGAVVRGVSQYKYSAGVRNVQQVINAPSSVIHQVTCTCTPVFFHSVLKLNSLAAMPFKPGVTLGTV